MSIEISADEAVKILSRAFLPLRCGAEAFDYNNFVRFCVFGANSESLVRMDKLTPMDFGSSSSLRSIVVFVRKGLIDRGFVLDSWETKEN